MATVASHLRGTLGLPVTSVELFNEPSGGWWKAAGTQEGCDFAHATQARVLASLPGAMARVGGLDGVRVAASDESFVDQVGGSVWRGLERGACGVCETSSLRTEQATATWAAFDDATRSIVDQVSCAPLFLGKILEICAQPSTTTMLLPALLLPPSRRSMSTGTKGAVATALRSTTQSCAEAARSSTGPSLATGTGRVVA